MKKYSFLIILFLIVSSSALSKEKIQLDSDEQTFDLNKNIISAKGNVIVKGKEISLKADMVEFEVKKERIKATGKVEFILKELYLSCGNILFDNKNKYFLAEGNPACRIKRDSEEVTIKSKTIEGYPEEKKIEAKGDVFIKSKEIEAKAQFLNFQQDEDKIILTGEAEVIKGENNLSGEKIIIFLKENKVKIEGKSKVRIKK